LLVVVYPSGCCLRVGLWNDEQRWSIWRWRWSDTASSNVLIQQLSSTHPGIFSDKSKSLFLS
jgi:hypothetical protein